MEQRNFAVFWTVKESTDWPGDVREWIWDELRNGRLRQGWAPPGSSLLEKGKPVSFDVWSRRYIRGVKAHWKDFSKLVPPGKVQTRYRILSLMTQFQRGDLVVVPRMPADDQFTIAEVGEGYEFVDRHYSTLRQDFGHVLHVNPNRLVTRRYASGPDSRLIVQKFPNYRDAVKMVRQAEYIDAIRRLWRDMERVPHAQAAGTNQSDDVSGSENERPRKGWSGPESEWHKSTVLRIASNPRLVGIRPADVVHRWCNACTSADGRSLWRRLRTGKRPDVVFELKGGRIVIIEVEPFTTYIDGLAQLAGDYQVAMLVDRRAMSGVANIEALLVVDTQLAEVRRHSEVLLPEHRIRVLQATE